jgi:hypothetical protein
MRRLTHQRARRGLTKPTKKAIIPQRELELLVCSQTESFLPQGVMGVIVVDHGSPHCIIIVAKAHREVRVGAVWWCCRLEPVEYVSVEPSLMWFVRRVFDEGTVGEAGTGVAVKSISASV